MTARESLRAATSNDHARVDRLFSAFNLADRSRYGSFLSAQAAAFLPVEAALDMAGADRLLPDWTTRRRAALLYEDLSELVLPMPEPIPSPPLPDDPSILGAIYVLEGSRLGGSVLKRQLDGSFPARFLDAEQAPGAWRKLLVKLDEFLYEPALLDTAAKSASQVFQRFERAASLYLETAVS